MLRAIMLAGLVILAGCDFEEFADSQRYTEDFHHTYELKSGGRLSVENFNGPVEIYGWDKNQVEIHGTKYASTKDNLATLKERKKVELEIAQLDQQIEAIKSPPKPEPKLSPMEERAKRHAESEARLDKLKEAKRTALKIEDEHERIVKVNAIDDEIQREMIEWSKTLP